MARIKNQPPVSVVRGEPLRQTVLDAAEALLRDGKADFSMRDLAARAGVSFATPFNQFGSKAAIMHALSARRIDEMTRRFSAAPSLSDAVGRVLLATAIGVEVMLEQPEVNRAVMGWIGTARRCRGWRGTCSRGRVPVAMEVVVPGCLPQRRLTAVPAWKGRGGVASAVMTDPLKSKTPGGTAAAGGPVRFPLWPFPGFQPDEAPGCRRRWLPDAMPPRHRIYAPLHGMW